jgi:alcohol dehydrogenase class IV
MSLTMPPKAHYFYAPHKVVFGLGAAAHLPAEAKALGAAKVLLVTDPGVVKAGLLQPLQEALAAAGLKSAVFGEVIPEPPSQVVDQAARMFQAEGCDLIVGLGGGSSLDVSKGVSLVVGNGGRILDYVGLDVAKKPGPPLILMPTTAGTGSETTRVLVVTDQAEATKKVVNSFFCLPAVALVDPQLTVSLPPQVTADTGLDALVHAVETYVSMNATPFSDVLAEKAIELIGQYLPLAWAKGSNIDARAHMSLAATLAGMAFASGGLGAVHALAYVLGTRYHMYHGRSNAIMLPYVMRYNIPGAPEKYALIAELLGKETEGLDDFEAAYLAAEAVEDLLETMNVPRRLCEYDIPEADMDHLVEGGMKQARLFVTNPRDLGPADVREIYEAAL